MRKISWSISFLGLAILGSYLLLDHFMVLSRKTGQILFFLFFLLLLVKDIQSHSQKRDGESAQGKIKNINEIIEAMLSTMDLEQLLRLITRAIKRELGFDKVFLYRLEEVEEKKLLKCIVSPGAVSEKGIDYLSVPLEDAGEVFSFVIEERKPCLVQDAVTDKRANSFLVNLLKLKSFAVIPIIIKGKATGTIVVSRTNPQDKIGQVDLSTLVVFANQIGIAIENARLLKEIKELTKIDELTTLYNQREFQRRLPEDIELARRYAHFLSLAMLDIDDFKYYNDNNGHLQGDRVLRQLGKILANNLRRTDSAFRYGGEEFAVILPATNHQGACTILERVRKEIEEFPFECGDKQPQGKVTVSIGVATYPIDASKADELIKCADVALYRAKAEGKNRVCPYNRLKEKTEMTTGGE